MTKPELLREIGVHLKKVVDIYNQLAKSPDSFSPGEIDMLVNNSAKIIEFAAVLKHQPASNTNSDDLIKLRDLEDKLRVLNEELKNKDFELEKLNRINQELEKKVEENKHLVNAFSIDIPEITTKIDSNSTVAKTDLLEETLTKTIPQIDVINPSTKTADIKIITGEDNKKEEIKAEKKEEKADVFTSPVVNTEKKEEVVPPQSFVSQYENAQDQSQKKTLISTLTESVIDGSENIAEKMMNTKVMDLKKAIPLHEKFHYTSELFAKNSDHYNQFIDAMNTKETWKEAEGLLAQAASMYKWDPENRIALQFIALIQRRFD
jgi:hypothetical protein